MNTPARYDGSAQWYDERFRHYGDLTEVDSSASLLATVLGRGDGWCLDVGCGTGLHAAAIESTGRRVFGVDLSADQLAHAAHRIAVRVRTDATRLPFRDGTFPSAVCTYVHTDIEQIGQVFAEVCRVMRHGGTFVYVGVHPCYRSVLLRGLRCLQPGRRVNIEDLRSTVGVRDVNIADCGR
jgi:ubiquinone/menaquinone biosynthesis C-methylase UbiE